MTPEGSRTREQVIESMCLTLRHDYHTDKGRFCGVTDDERNALHHQMTQLFDNNIAPFMEFRSEPRNTEVVHDGIIKIQSFELTEREQKRMSLGLKYGPASAYMKDDGSPIGSSSCDDYGNDGRSWADWFSRKFFRRC